MGNYFYAMLHRMRYIERWSLMRNAQSENLQEHTLEVAYFAHALALIRRSYFPDLPAARPETCVMLALYHDVSEIITGDLPTPIKYFNDQIHRSFKEVEGEALDLMVQGIPEEIQGDYVPYLYQEAADDQAEDFALAKPLVKAADTLSAYLKCLDELAVGNHEFQDAAESTREKLLAYDLPEVQWFLENCLADFGRTLDDLRAGRA